MDEELTLNQALLPSETPKRPPVRGGVILISSLVFDMFGISLRDCNTQGRLEDAGVFAEVHKELRLPANYTIHFLFYRWSASPNWEVGVTSPDLPIMEEFTEPPILTPIYTRSGDGTTSLLKIRIEGKWQRTYRLDELTVERL